MPDTDKDRPVHLRGLNDDQVALYDRMLGEVSARHGTYWDCLRGLDAPAADKYALAEALHDWPAQLEYGPPAGIDPYHGKVDMTTLRRGDEFIGPDGHTRYVVTTPAAEHEHGWVGVRDLSMPAEEAARRAEQPELYGPDSRAGFFAYTYPTYVEPVENTYHATAAPVADLDDADEA